MGFNYLCIFPPGYVALWGFKAHHRLSSKSVSWCLETSLFKDSISSMDLHPYLFCLSFCLLYFFLPPFKDNGLLFWVPDVLCRRSEVVLRNLLRVQMFFWWICGGESGIPFLFLCHLRTASRTSCWIYSFNTCALLPVLRNAGSVHFVEECCP